MKIQAISTYKYSSFTSNQQTNEKKNNTKKIAAIASIIIVPVTLSAISLFVSGRYKNIPKENKFKNTLVALKNEFLEILDCL